MESAALDFLNSYWRDYRTSGRWDDRLDEPGWLAQFLEQWSLDVSTPLEAVQREQLRELRATLWRIVEALDAGNNPMPRDIDALNGTLAATPIVRVLEPGETRYRLVLTSSKRDWNWVRAEIAASFAQLLTEHDPARVKLCGNEDCRWVFYDESKSRSRRWCADVCGNLLKVRKFRARARSTHQGPDE